MNIVCTIFITHMHNYVIGATPMGVVKYLFFASINNMSANLTYPQCYGHLILLHVQVLLKSTIYIISKYHMWYMLN